jgi:hypothetical protein
LKKLSYKSEQIGDYHIFYISENKIKYKRGGSTHDTSPVSTNGRKPKTMKYPLIKITSKFAIDNSNLGMNPQTITLKWQIADISFLDSLSSDEDEFGRYKKLGWAFSC